MARSRLIEADEFPFDFLSKLAERESWRKEIYRPIYHVHKWWATRLGSIFRGILLGSLLPAESDLEDAFFKEHSFTGITVFDPFMGSGTTIGEAHKLGCSVLGRDINPVAAESVRVVFGAIDPQNVQEEFQHLEATIGKRIRDLHKASDEKGREYETLYYFWIKQVRCLRCDRPVDLCKSRVIGRHASPHRKLDIRISCPGCGAIINGTLNSVNVSCSACGCHFDPRRGNVNGSKASCSHCGHGFRIVDAARKADHPPQHRLIGKLVLSANGDKCYLPPTEADRTAYSWCEQELARQLREGSLTLPSLCLQNGHNTRQAMNYGYRSWRDFFNARQLLSLGWLHQAILEIPNPATRDLFSTLFSSTLEFNNLFASYKGEGTGAVRHMFSHHILKPERMPIEANVWGTSKSSGAFSGLYRRRLLRAIDYRRHPTEVPQPRRRSGHPATKGAVLCSQPFLGEVQTVWPPVFPLASRSIHISCGSSHATDLPAKSIDLIVTDPPFFDNVHYSELADFFFAWQSLYPRGFLHDHKTTRSDQEVQDKRADAFAHKLTAVFRECHRVLKDDGTLIFTYHHSRPEGWTALASAICGAAFSIVTAHPVKAEMSVASPKSLAKEPIQLDVILVCMKRDADRRQSTMGTQALTKGFHMAVTKVARLRAQGFELSRNDRRVILFSQFMAELGPVDDPEGMVQILSDQVPNLEAALDDARFLALPVLENAVNQTVPPSVLQRSLFDE